MLAELDVGAEADQQLVEAWNKIDQLDPDEQVVLAADEHGRKTRRPAAARDFRPRWGGGG